MPQQFDIALTGCNPTPLSGYLRALAVLRLVGEQIDSEAQGWWEHDVFHLRSTLGREALIRFFSDQYVPTPILAPWNSASGFYPKRASAFEVVMAMSEAQSERFAPYRTAIVTARQLVAEMGLKEGPEKQEKTNLLALCRSWLPDEAVEWLDAAVVLTADNPRFPPLLGTGGNDGNLEFTNNFMQRLIDLFDLDAGVPKDNNMPWLESALFGTLASDLPSVSTGQFSPGSTGGPNGRAGFKGAVLANPWEFVLNLEGALVFAAAATKRLETARTAVLSYPFTVYSVGVGSGAVNEVDEASSRPEMWMPLWNRPASYREISHVFQEGRVDVKGRPVRDGLDFARACAALAVDRGIDSFQRYAFVQRSGNMYLAAPLNRFVVARRPQADILSELDRGNWLNRFGAYARKSGAHSIQSAYQQIREAMFQLCAHGGGPRVQALLIALGKAERLLAKNSAALTEIRTPLTLNSTRWLEYADDGSAEFELAAAIAGWHTHDMPHVRAYFTPVAARNPKAWSDVVEPRVIWKDSDLTRNLIQLLHRRILDADVHRKESTNHPADGEKRGDLVQRENTTAHSTDKPFGGYVTASLPSVIRFLVGEVDDQRIMDLVWGLLPLSATDALKTWAFSRPRRRVRNMDIPHVPWTYAVTRLVSTPDETLRRALNLLDSVRIPMPRELLALLTSDSHSGIDRATVTAVRRLRISGFGMDNKHFQVVSRGLSGRRCAAALAFPLSYADLGYLRKLVHVEAQNSNEEERSQ
ncbi:type I-U CRISPR-associated protein Csx17 [Alicyclobacillus cycloheptanicus]|uniref:CRISPR-associated protein Csx17 n=1 Tax=Alicyclobacillus cycloheptanicus TaxID=1457 RepID=A0ABT9XH59_9BACL|nr:type I-U CRISPR-associated protein Csx17 [Alicyclobacillus cycloheptanicus]MDQ0189636.1 CRISPR-associated protein Csx17 [Alicyclobacillus cycloheptanicus]WDL99941.1 type I-U CRISPR-associated protein Csx17 [Alicyclobacillus cycloheptanicus]